MNFALAHAEAAGMDPDRAESAAGTILSALHLSCKKRDVIGALERAVPDMHRLMAKGAAMSGGGRTAEMFAFVADVGSAGGMQKLTAQLTRQGISPEEARGVGRALLDRLGEAEGAEVVDRLLEGLPAFRDFLG